MPIFGYIKTLIEMVLLGTYCSKHFRHTIASDSLENSSSCLFPRKQLLEM